MHCAGAAKELEDEDEDKLEDEDELEEEDELDEDEELDDELKLEDEELEDELDDAGRYLRTMLAPEIL